MRNLILSTALVAVLSLTASPVSAGDDVAKADEETAVSVRLQLHALHQAYRLVLTPTSDAGAMPNQPVALTDILSSAFDVECPPRVLPGITWYDPRGLREVANLG